MHWCFRVSFKSYFFLTGFLADGFVLSLASSSALEHWGGYISL